MERLDRHRLSSVMIGAWTIERWLSGARRQVRYAHDCRARRQLRCSGHPSATLTQIFDIVPDELGSVNYDQFFDYDGSGAAGISIYQSPDANALSTTAAVVAKMKAPSALIPRGFV